MRLLAVILLLCVSCAVFAGQIQVTSNTWMTWANANAVAGDTVFIHSLGGVAYNVPIAPVNIGRIVYMNYQADVCSLYTTSACVNITTDTIIVQGLALQLAPHYKATVIAGTDCNHGAIINCRVYGGTTNNNGADWGNWATITLSTVNYWRIIGNWIDRQDVDITANEHRGDAIVVYGDSHYNIIEGNCATRVSHFCFGGIPYVWNASMNIIRNNKAWGAHGLFGVAFGSTHNLVEGNEGHGPDQVDTYRSGSALEAFARYTIYRYNKIAHDSTVVPLYGRVTTATEYIIEYDSPNDNVERDSWNYNNAYTAMATYPTGGDYTWKFVIAVNDAGMSNDLARLNWFNNIIAFSTDTTLWFYKNYYTPFADPTDTAKGNLLWRGTPGRKLFTTRTRNHSGTYTLAEAKSAFPQWIDGTNIEASPGWADSNGRGANRNYTLLANSPCIDRAVALTLVASNVSSAKVIPVGNAGWAHYDWGRSPYDSGDSIAIKHIGVFVRAKLDSVDYPGNKLITTANVTVSAGDSIWVLATYNSATGLYTSRLSGDRPDIGPYEYTTPPTPPVSPTVPKTGYLLGRRTVSESVYLTLISSDGYRLISSDGLILKVRP